MYTKMTPEIAEKLIYLTTQEGVEVYVYDTMVVGGIVCPKFCTLTYGDGYKVCVPYNDRDVHIVVRKTITLDVTEEFF